MRARKRPDWPVLVYKFWVEPIGDIPQELWQIAQLMKTTWNNLVDLREEIRTAIDKIENITPEQKKTEWGRFDEKAKKVVKESGLNWECQGEILDRFKTACTSKKHPKHHHRLERISIPHRFTAGGREVSKLFSQSSKAFGLDSVKEEAYLSDKQENRRLRGSRGYFGLEETKVDFLINLHRPLPKSSFIKKVSFLGTNKGVLGWEWAVAITVEEPPSIIQTVLPKRVCGIDLGWRKFDEYVRVAVLVDNEGRAIEFRLPFNASTAGTRRYNQKYKQNPIIDDWRDLEEVQRKIDLLVEELKEKLRELLPEQLPEEIKVSVAQLTKMRQGGLVRLLYQLEQAKVAPECQTEIKVWRQVNDGLRRRVSAAKDRFLARRHWLYQNIALWIAENYSEIAWEGNLGLKWMAQTPTEEEEKNMSEEQKYALRNSQVYRHFAALGEFREDLKAACEKTGAKIISSKAKNTSSICAICSTTINVGTNRMCECENGHRMDNDINAGLNMLKQTGIKLEERLIQTVYREHYTVLEKVPEQIKPFCRRLLSNK